jgi:hypothetical protein
MLGAGLLFGPFGYLTYNLPHMFDLLRGRHKVESWETEIPEVLGWSWRRFWPGLLVGLILTLLIELTTAALPHHSYLK